MKLLIYIGAIWVLAQFSLGGMPLLAVIGLGYVVYKFLRILDLLESKANGKKGELEGRPYSDAAKEKNPG